MLHPEPAWIDPSGVLKYTSSTYAIIFFCQIYETAGFNRQNIGSRGLEVYFCFLMAMSHIGLQSWRVTHIQTCQPRECFYRDISRKKAGLAGKKRDGWQGPHCDFF